MSERTGRSKVRTSIRRRRTRELIVSPGARSRSPLGNSADNDAGITSNFASGTLSKPKLLIKMKDLGVDFPSTLGIKHLRQVYDRLTKTNAVETEQPDFSPSINCSAAARAAEVNSTAENGSSADSPISGVCRQLLELQSVVASINHRLNSTAIATATTDNNQLSGQNASSYIQGTQTQGIPIDTLPPINIISPQLKKTIEERKRVNLALLLIPGMSNDKETRIIDQEGTT